MVPAREEVTKQPRRWPCQLQEWGLWLPRTGLFHSWLRPWHSTTSPWTTPKRCRQTGEDCTRNTTSLLLVRFDSILLYFDCDSRAIYPLKGGGSAGAVVANRLSEERRWRVLLLEAGGQETPVSDTPMLSPYLQLGSMDWRYRPETQPGRACLGKHQYDFS